MGARRSATARTGLGHDLPLRQQARPTGTTPQHPASPKETADKCLSRRDSLYVPLSNLINVGYQAYPETWDHQATGEIYQGRHYVFLEPGSACLTLLDRRPSSSGSTSWQEVYGSDCYPCTGPHGRDEHGQCLPGNTPELPKADIVLPELALKVFLEFFDFRVGVIPRC